ncbi:MAG: hypothetical protein J6J31_13205 [Thermoguttaceae bacterium]|nr:hypothetical protein [Thermoguttaceae bacterium]
MFNTKTAAWGGAFFLLVTSLGAASYQEHQKHSKTEAALQAIVQQDMDRVEKLMAYPSTGMKAWGEYLNISELKSALHSADPDSRQLLDRSIVTCNFAYGVDSKPELTALRDSLTALRKWQKSSIFETFFAGTTASESLLTDRALHPVPDRSELLLAANVEKTAEQKSERMNEIEAPAENSAELFTEDDEPSVMLALEDTELQEDSHKKDGTNENMVSRSRKTSPLQRVLAQKNQTSSSSQDSLNTEQMLASKNTAIPAEQEVSPDVSEPVPLAPPTLEGVSENAVAENDVTENAVAENDVTENAVSENAVAENDVTENAVTENTVAENDVTENTAENDALEAQRVDIAWVAPEIPGNELTVPELPFESETPGSACEENQAEALAHTDTQDSREKEPEMETEIPDLNEEIVAVQDAEMPKQNESAISSQAARQDAEKASNAANENASEDELHAETSDDESLLALPKTSIQLEAKLAEFALNLTDAPSIDELTLSGNFEQDARLLFKVWAHAQYEVPQEEDLTAAYTQIRAAANRVERLFAKTPAAKRQLWKQLLHWDVLQLEKEADHTALLEVFHRLSCGVYGLELEYFTDLQNAIGHYLALEAQLHSPAYAEKLFRDARGRMRRLLLLAISAPTSEVQCAIADLTRWLEKTGQAKPYVCCTRAMWSQPNIVAHVSNTVFERYGSRFIEMEDEIRNQIPQGTIRGKSLFSGNLTVGPVLNPEKIEIGIILDGSSDSKTRTYAGPAIISSRAKSRIFVGKNILMDETGLDSTPAKVQIRTNSRIEGVQDIRNRHLIENFVTRRAFAKKDETERQAIAENTVRLRQRFDSAIDTILNEWNSRYEEILFRHLAPRNVHMAETQMWSDDTGVHARMHLLNSDAFSAPETAPEPCTPCDIYFAVHETSLQNITAGFFRGVLMNERAGKQLLASMPKWLNAEQDAEDASEKAEKSSSDSQYAPEWNIQFIKEWPMKASLRDGKIRLSLHCSKLTHESKTYPPLDISVTYAVNVQDGMFVLVREGGVEILPSDFDPTVKKRLPASIVSLRRVMGKRLQEVFKDEVEIKEVPVLKNAGDAAAGFAKLRIRPIFIQAENGWFQMGLNFTEENSGCPQNAAAQNTAPAH